MITKFKLYEAINQGEPEVGDYVIANSKDAHSDNVKKVFNTTIGQIKSIHNRYGFLDSYVVLYGVPTYSTSEMKDTDSHIVAVYKWWFTPREIEYWSKNKSELEDLLLMKKYNL